MSAQVVRCLIRVWDPCGLTGGRHSSGQGYPLGSHRDHQICWDHHRQTPVHIRLCHVFILCEGLEVQQIGRKALTKPLHFIASIFTWILLQAAYPTPNIKSKI